jgi:hypothetical protein
MMRDIVKLLGHDEGHLTILAVAAAVKLLIVQSRATITSARTLSPRK